MGKAVGREAAMSLFYTFSALSFALVSGQADDIYPCDITTAFPPTVFAPTDHWGTPTAVPTVTPSNKDLVLVGGAGPHQGNVMVNSPDGGYGAILSCSDDYAYCSAGQGTWSCSEAEVVCHQLGYAGAESYSVGNKYGMYGDDYYRQFTMKNVICEGDESNLLDCDNEWHYGLASWDGRIAGVSCLEVPLSSTTTWEPDTSSSFPATSTSTPSFCPSGWLDAGHLGCFLLQENITVDSWYEANIVCEDLGGFLMEPKSAETQSLVSSLLIMLTGELSRELDWWIGLTDTGHEGAWVWVHEAEFAEEQFWATPPDTSEGNHADCALLSRDHDYMWKDAECWGSEKEQPRGVLCQR